MAIELIVQESIGSLYYDTKTEEGFVLFERDGSRKITYYQAHDLGGKMGRFNSSTLRNAQITTLDFDINKFRHIVDLLKQNERDRALEELAGYLAQSYQNAQSALLVHS